MLEHKLFQNITPSASSPLSLQPNLGRAGLSIGFRPSRLSFIKCSNRTSSLETPFKEDSKRTLRGIVSVLDFLWWG